MRARPFSKLVLLSALLIVALVSFAAQDARAAGKTFTVNATTDAVDVNPGDGVCATAEGKCTLRAAVQEANATPGADTIVLPSGTFKLTIVGDDDTAAAGDLDILEDVTVQGAGSSSTIIDANHIDRAFDIYHGQFTGQHIDISGVTIRNGLADYGAGIMINPQATPGNVTLTDVVVRDSHATLAGGGIANHEHLVISGSVITGNKAASGDIGGGIFNVGDLTVTDSTIGGNSADAVGGGLYNLSHAVISGSTFSGNSAGSEGGGVANTGGIVMLTNVTFSGNTAGTKGGAIYNGVAGSQMTLLNVTLAGDDASTGTEISHDNTGPFHLKNTIVAGATAGKNCAGTLSSDGHNLASDATCGLTHGGDKKNTDPVLGPLADNGGPTQTRALLAGSPAIDAGSGDCPPPAADQRGTARPQGAGCDIGAFEVVGVQRVWGDLRCDGGVDASDSLADLLHVAEAAPISQTTPCPHIGSSVEVLVLWPPDHTTYVTCPAASARAHIRPGSGWPSAGPSASRVIRLSVILLSVAKRLGPAGVSRASRDRVTQTDPSSDRIEVTQLSTRTGAFSVLPAPAISRSVPENKACAMNSATALR